MGVQRIVHLDQLKIATYEQQRAFLGVELPDQEPEGDRGDSDEESESEDETPPAKWRRVA